MQQRQQLAAESSELAAVSYPVAAWQLACDILGEFSRGVWRSAVRSTQPAIQNSSDGSSSSGSTSQAAASAALLAVVLARSLVQLADAMEAAGGPQLLFDCQKRQSFCNLKWLPGDLVNCMEQGAVILHGSAAQQNVRSQWQFWQLAVLHALQPLVGATVVLGMVELAGDAEYRAAAAAEEVRAAAAAAAISAAGPDVTANSSSNGQESNASSSSSSRPKWGHLLHLQHFSPDWAAAVEAFAEKWPRWCDDDVEATYAQVLDGTLLMLDSNTSEVQLLFDDVLQLVRELVDAAPLPVVCNNPGCESLAGVSEAAAGCKACAVCRCRYCSVACQRTDWKRHKPACKRMAAAGMTCA
jgi:hypothetical protein